MDSLKATQLYKFNIKETSKTKMLGCTYVYQSVHPHLVSG